MTYYGTLIKKNVWIIQTLFIIRCQTEPSPMSPYQRHSILCYHQFLIGGQYHYLDL